MDVVADTRAIRGWIVIAEYAQLSTFAHSNLCDVRHQVVRDAVGVLPYPTTGMGTDGIEIAQQHDVPLLIGFLHVHHDFLKHALGLTVRIGAMSLGALLRDRDDGRVAIDGGRRREDDVFASMLTHHIKQSQCAADVVFVIFPRFFHALAHGLQASEVDAGIETMGFHHTVEAFTITDVDFIKRDFLARQFRHTLQRLAVGVAEVIDNHSLVTCSSEFHQSVRADEAGTACD